MHIPGNNSREERYIARLAIKISSDLDCKVAGVIEIVKAWEHSNFAYLRQLQKHKDNLLVSEILLLWEKLNKGRLSSKNKSREPSS